jgi:hypothetical protein
MRMQVTLVDAIAHVESTLFKVRPCGVHGDRRGSRNDLTRSRRHLGDDDLGRYGSTTNLNSR